jgi:AmmeMemoRadiSam system protein B
MALDCTEGVWGLRTRRPCVAGTFYPSDQRELLKLIENCFTHELGPGKLPQKGGGLEEGLPALLSPHAGYIYSGPVASHGYLLLSGRKRPHTVVVVGPNHTGLGSDVSLYPEGKWLTPLGAIDIDVEFTYSLVRRSERFTIDDYSHANEHSIEVQLPFLQYVLEGFKLVPICMLDQSKATSLEVGDALAEAMAGGDALLIVSSDMTHYEPAEEAKKKDEKVLSAIMALDVGGLYSTIASTGSTACGCGPMAIAIRVAQRLGTKRATLLKYANSGDIMGDERSVVGYASVAFERGR